MDFFLNSWVYKNSDIPDDRQECWKNFIHEEPRDG
jgi:hypothetical protein